MSEMYIRYKDSKQEPEYLHNNLKALLNDTFGQMIYQEQMMQICWSIANLDLVTADLIRIATGKKRPELMMQQKDGFITGCIKSGYSKDIANRLWEFIEKTAEYQFCKAHAINYSLVTYKTAFLKSHFAKEFFCSLLNCAKYDQYPQEEITEIITDCWRFGISLIPPNLNRLGKDFEIIDEKNIGFGACNIKGIGEAKSKNLNQFVKGNSLAKSIMRLINLTDKGTVRSLINCGAFDEYTKNRAMLAQKTELIYEFNDREFEEITRLVEEGSNIQPAVENLLERMEQNPRWWKEMATPKKNATATIPKRTRATPVRKTLEQMKEADSIKTTPAMAAMLEKELMGFVLSDIGKSYYKGHDITHKCGETWQGEDNDTGSVFATIDDIKLMKNMKGEQVASLVISDDTGSFSGMRVTAKNFPRLESLIYQGATRLFNFKFYKNRTYLTDLT
jgi:DNA polymerase III alpha subunit